MLRAARFILRVVVERENRSGKNARPHRETSDSRSTSEAYLDSSREIDTPPASRRDFWSHFVKRNIALQHRDFQRYLSATATGLAFCAIALYSLNGPATEARTFSVVANPALATYVDNADVTHTAASNAVQMKVTQAASTNPTQKSVQAPRPILLASCPSNVAQSCKFNARKMDSAFTPRTLFYNLADGHRSMQAMRSAALAKGFIDNRPLLLGGL